MRKRMLWLFILSSIGLNAQESKKWGFGIEFSKDNLSNVNYVFTRLANNLEFGNTVTFNETNYSIGAKIEYKNSQRFSIFSGILFSNKDFSGVEICPTCIVLGNIAIPEDKRTILQFLTIPVGLNYLLVKTKVKPVLELGFKNNIEIKNDLKQYSKGYFLEGLVGLALKYPFRRNWNIALGYRYQKAISQLFKTDSFDLKTNSLVFKISYQK